MVTPRAHHCLTCPHRLAQGHISQSSSIVVYPVYIHATCFQSAQHNNRTLSFYPTISYPGHTTATCPHRVAQEQIGSRLSASSADGRSPPRTAAALLSRSGSRGSGTRGGSLGSLGHTGALGILELRQMGLPSARAAAASSFSMVRSAAHGSTVQYTTRLSFYPGSDFMKLRAVTCPFPGCWIVPTQSGWLPQFATKFREEHSVSSTVPAVVALEWP